MVDIKFNNDIKKLYVPKPRGKMTERAMSFTEIANLARGAIVAEEGGYFDSVFGPHKFRTFEVDDVRVGQFFDKDDDTTGGRVKSKEAAREEMEKQIAARVFDPANRDLYLGQIEATDLP